MFMTDDQKKYYAAMKKMGNKKPVKATPRPRVNELLFAKRDAGQDLLSHHSKAVISKSRAS